MTFNKIKIYAIIGICLLILSFFLGRCSIGTVNTKVKITTPEIKGISKEILNPKPEKKIKRNSIIYRDSVIYHTEFNKDLAQEFINTKSDIDKLEQFIKAVELNDYIIPYDDKYISTKSYIKTEGKLISFKQDYFIKEQVVAVDVKVPNNVNFLIGTTISNTIKLDKFNIDVNLGLQRKNKDIILIGYGLDKTIKAGYLFKF